MSSFVLDSSGLWLMPELMPRTKSMACGITSCSFIASWPAPLEGVTADDADLAVQAFQKLLEQHP